MDKTLQMVFVNQSGSNSSISISQVKDELTGDEVKTLMNTLISKNIFDTTGGDLVSIKSASVISRDVQELSVK